MAGNGGGEEWRWQGYRVDRESKGRNGKDRGKDVGCGWKENGEGGRKGNARRRGRGKKGGGGEVAGGRRAFVR